MRKKLAHGKVATEVPKEEALSSKEENFKPRGGYLADQVAITNAAEIGVIDDDGHPFHSL